MANSASLSSALLKWYDRHRRILTWRAAPGERPDPYRVWLSEIMLQQTTAKVVAPYYARFLSHWPDVYALAAASLGEVMKAWAGLGYYARARNLHACARAVVERHRGQFPANEAALRALPGIGGYTAAAIAAIAYGEPTAPIDGNIGRVVARLYAVSRPTPAARREIFWLARSLTPPRRPGDFAQAMMDLGATICTPKKPACGLCPWNRNCAAHSRGDPENFPQRRSKRERALRRGAAFVARRADGFVLVRTRPAKGLLGGMTEVPTTEWVKDFDENNALKTAPRFVSHSRDAVAGSRMGVREQQEVCWRRAPGVVRHVFTHFPLELAVYVADLPADTPAPNAMRWVAFSKVSDEGLPSVMRKVVAHAPGV